MTRETSQRNKYEPEDAKELLKRDIPPARHVVEDLLTEGLVIAGADQKTGKSFLGLLLALSIAMEWPFLGRDVIQGCSALYLDLENGQRITQDRLFQLLDGASLPDGRLHIVYEWPRFDQKDRGLERLGEYLDAHPEIVLVVLDMLVSVRPPRKPSDGAGIYEGDEAFISRINHLAVKHHVAIVALHHTNEKPFNSDAPMNSLSGSRGLIGGSSMNWLLHGSHGKDTADLYIDARELGIRHVPIARDDLHGGWLLDPNRADSVQDAPVVRATARDRVLEEFRQSGTSLSLTYLYERTGLPKRLLRDTCSKLYRQGQLTREREGDGLYVLAPPATQADVSRLLTPDQADQWEVLDSSRVIADEQLISNRLTSTHP